MTDTQLIAMAGLPGAGKSTIADLLSRQFPAMLLSIDPIEAALRRSGWQQERIGSAGYLVAEALAIETLKRGQTVIIDAVNPVQAARDMWVKLAQDVSVPLTFLEVVCSDAVVHRQRIESRVRGIEGLTEVSWERVLKRKQEYQPWSNPRRVLDTSKTSAEALVESVLPDLRRS